MSGSYYGRSFSSHGTTQEHFPVDNGNSLPPSGSPRRTTAGFSATSPSQRSAALGGSNLSPNPLSPTPSLPSALLPSRTPGPFRRSRSAVAHDQYSPYNPSPTSPSAASTHLSESSYSSTPIGSPYAETSQQLNSPSPPPEAGSSSGLQSSTFPTYPYKNVPLYPRSLPDGLIQSLQACIMQVDGAECMACDLMQTKRNSRNVRHSKRHIEEVHAQALTITYSQGLLISQPVLDALYIAITALRMVSHRARPRPASAVIAEAKSVVEMLSKPASERPETFSIPSVREGLQAFYQHKMGFQCEFCGRRYTRISSLKRHNCTAGGGSRWLAIGNSQVPGPEAEGHADEGEPAEDFEEEDEGDDDEEDVGQ